MSLSPTAPSAVGLSAGAVITGRVNGVTAAATSMDTFTAMDSRALTVSVVGTNISTTINGSGQFTLSDVPAGTVQLKFEGSGVNATVVISGVAASDRIDITVTVNGHSARIESERRGRGNGQDDNARVEVKGPVASRNGTCPAAIFIVQGTRITTNAATLFDDVTCAGLRNGMQVEVEGQRQADGSVLATRVEAEDDDNVNQRVELKGPVAARNGTCPMAAFMVNGTRVTTNAATIFDDVTCAGLQNGMQVEVEGQRQADGSVLAARIEGKDEDDEQRVSGVVSGLGGGCPAITFAVQGVRVTTSSATRFKDMACAAVVNGRRVEVRGQGQGGTILASRVEPEDDDDEDEDDD